MPSVLLRFVVTLLGVGLLGGVIWLGFAASTDPRYIVWFGLAAAILAPAGIAAISYSFTAGSNETLARLEKIPQIERLIKEAQTQEEKIKLLAEEREQLIAAIELETRKQALTTRMESLEADAADLVSELKALDEELTTLDVEIENSKAREIVSALNERLGAHRRGDVVLKLAGRYFTLNRNLILSLPMGRLLLSYFQLLQSLGKKRRDD